jgi:hypothetical protein
MKPIIQAVCLAALLAGSQFASAAVRNTHCEIATLREALA